MHFLGLALNPCALMVIDTEGRVPQGNVLGWTVSGEWRERFAYPPPIKTDASEAPQMVATAVLSVTAKAEARAARKSATTPILSPVTAMQVDEQPVREEGKPSEEASKQDKEITKPDSNKEPQSIHNFTRLLPEELAHLEDEQECEWGHHL